MLLARIGKPGDHGHARSGRGAGSGRHGRGALPKEQVRQAGPGARSFQPARAIVAIAQVVGIETVEPGMIVHAAEGLATVQVGGVQLTASAPAGIGRDVFVCIRGEDVLVQEVAAGTSARNRLAARVTSRVAEGPMVRIGLDCGFALTALVTRPACEELNCKSATA